jgi:hypothetical protein
MKHARLSQIQSRTAQGSKLTSGEEERLVFARCGSAKAGFTFPPNVAVVHFYYLYLFRTYNPVTSGPTHQYNVN